MRQVASINADIDARCIVKSEDHRDPAVHRVTVDTVTSSDVTCGDLTRGDVTPMKVSPSKLTGSDRDQEL